jgi:hypothetical protein
VQYICLFLVGGVIGHLKDKRPRNSGHFHPGKAIERELWAVWFGSLLACALMVVAMPPGLFEGQGHRIPIIPTLFAACLVAGTTFICLGSRYWRLFFYAIGVSFFALARVMVTYPQWAVLVFTIAACLTSCLIAWRLRQRPASD